MSEETLPTREESYVLDSLSSVNRAAMLTNSNGEILIAHDRPITDPVQWIEYDTTNNSFTIVHKGGKTQDLGLKIDKSMKTDLTHGRDVFLAHMVEQQVITAQRAILVVRDY